jgi:hypothetical protein
MAQPSQFGPGPYITPGRLTTVSLDEPDFTVQQESFDREYTLDQIGPENLSLVQNVQFYPNKGWGLTSHQSTLQEFHELGLGTPLQTTDFNLAGDGTNSGWLARNVQRWNADLPGVPQGALTAEGDPWMWKFVGGSQTWAQILSADQASFPGPNPGGDNVPLDRVAVAKAAMLPGTDLVFRFMFGGSTGQAPQRINDLYFTSIPGYAPADSAQGSGAYSLIFQGDGFAVLNELLQDNTWTQRHSFLWEVPGRVVGEGTGHICKLSSDAQLLSSGLWVGTRIFFTFTDTSENTSLSQSLENYILAQQVQTYQIPNKTGRPLQPAAYYPIRVDWRRDVVGAFQLSLLQFTSANGILPGRTFPLATTYRYGSELRIEYFGYFPPGTAVAVSLKDQDGTVVPLSGNSFNDLTSGYVGFLPWGSNPTVPLGPNYTPTFTLSTVNAEASPIINRQRNRCDGVIRAYTPTPVVISQPNKVQHLSLSGATADLSQESIAVKVTDLSGALNVLRQRASMLMMVKTQTGEFNEDKSPKESVLSRAYVAIAARTQYGNFTGKNFPASDWGTYEIKGTGMWQRLWEMTMPTTIDFSYDPSRVDPNTGVTLPFKVTDIIRILLRYRFPPNMVIIPDKSLSFLGNSNNNGKGPSLLIEFEDQIGPYIIELAKSYYGGWLTFDGNATSIAGQPPDPSANLGATDFFGAWRLLLPPSAPFNNLWAFWTTPQTQVFAPPLSPAVYPDTQHPLGSGLGVQIVRNTWIRRLFRNDVQPPEFNAIWVSGQGIGQPGLLQAGSDDKIQLTSRAFNPSSAWFYDTQDVPPDPTSPDYLGRVVQVYKGDPGDVSQAACDFDARRTIQIAGHGRKRVVIEAPLMFNTDLLDPFQIRPRPPRFGDPALVNGQQFYISSVNPSYAFEEGGDRAQMCIYEMYSIYNPPDFVPASDDVFN